MPALPVEFLSTLQGDGRVYPEFVETGTYISETIRAMEPYFTKLYTIEVSPQLYHHSVSQYNGTKINYILGDSVATFRRLLPNLYNDTVFFLDAHFSQGITSKAEKDVPLLEEIQLINTLFKPNAILIIDDFRLFGKGPSTGDGTEDWNDVSKDKIIEILKDRIEKVYVLPSSMDPEDRLVIHITSSS